MSYILEALRKAEQRREQEEPSKVPTFLTGPVPESGRRTRLWPYVVSAVLLLNAGLLVWRLIPRQVTPAPPLVETIVRKEPGLAARAPAKSSRKPAPSTVARKENHPPAVSVVPSKPLVGSEIPPVSQPRVEQPQPSPVPRSSAVNELSEPVVNPQARAGKQRPGASGRLFSLSELPPAVRGALPEFRVSGHAYTPEPQTRVVRINERILQEGQELLPGLKLEEIVQGGVVMSYDGYRFRINIKEN
jgi:general secretion pathway protein B